MAGHLARAGHRLTVYNRTTSKAEAWRRPTAAGWQPVPARRRQGAEIVFTCVGNDDDVTSVVTGDDGCLAGMAAGAVLVDHTTDSAQLARRLHGEAAEVGVGFVDAPVSGGQAGAEGGRLTVMCGGDADVFERVRPVMLAYARAVTRLGPAGSGQLTKMVNQICIAGVLQGLAEGLDFGRRAGLDLDEVVAVISQGAAQSWQMENRAATMARGEFDFGFAVQWMRKDLAICLAEARRSGARLPVTALVDQFYAQVEARGGRRWDTSSLIHLLAHD